MDPSSDGKRTHLVVIVEFLHHFCCRTHPLFSPYPPKNISSFSGRLAEGENDGTEVQAKKATLPDLREMVRSESAAWQAAENMWSHGMPTAMACQEVCRMESKEPFLF
jgi:hypothetical protein